MTRPHLFECRAVTLVGTGLAVWLTTACAQTDGAAPLTLGASGSGGGAARPVRARPLPAVTGARQHLRWKRFRAVQNDFARALALPPSEVCTDGGSTPCAVTTPFMLTDYLRTQGVEEADLSAACAQRQGSETCNDAPLLNIRNPRGLHVLALGGNDPLAAGVLEPIAVPSLGTSLALDRFALIACGERAARDAAGPSVVFTHLDLSIPSVTKETPGTRETVADLYRRFLGRDAEPAETDAVLSLVDGTPLPGRQFARLACYAVSTSLEAMFQ
jgi:hypothetical protein